MVTDNATSRSHISAAPAAPQDTDWLIDRIRAGDREAAANFVLAYGPRIRWRVRQKLGSRMRRLFDSQEILSTVARRLDQYVCAQTLSSISRDRLWALLVQITEHAVADKVRVIKRLSKVEAEDRPFAESFAQAIEGAVTGGDAEAAEFLSRALGAISDATDRTILNLWLNGYSHPEIGASVGLDRKAVEWRWRRIRARLHEYFSAAPGTVDAA